MRLSLPDAASTLALGEALGRSAEEGDVLALDGDLGAGKTTLTQGLGKAIGVVGVTSPTFQLVFVHEGGRLPLVHADLYRLEARDLPQLGFDELFGVVGVTVVEWASQVPEAVPDDRLELRLTEEGQGRCAMLAAHGPRARAWLARLEVPHG